MPQGPFVEVLMCHLGHKNKESCHCSTGAARVSALQCSLESAEGKCDVHGATTAFRLTHAMDHSRNGKTACGKKWGYLTQFK